MDEQRFDDQQEPIYTSSVTIKDGAWRTTRERCTIETDGVRGLGRFMLAARRDDDGDLKIRFFTIDHYHYLLIFRI